MLSLGETLGVGDLRTGDTSEGTILRLEGDTQFPVSF
jgi:hypothetical protein